MGADYQEITMPVAGPTTGHFALIVYPIGAGGGGAINVNIIQQSGFEATTLTIVPLGAGVTYNSSSFDFNNSMLGFTLAMAFSNQASAVNGFMVQQSIDNVNWDLNSAVASVLASTGLGIKAAQTVRYARIQYTNGGVAQATFRLGARFSIA